MQKSVSSAADDLKYSFGVIFSLLLLPLALLLYGVSLLF